MVSLALAMSSAFGTIRHSVRRVRQPWLNGKPGQTGLFSGGTAINRRKRVQNSFFYFLMTCVCLAIPSISYADVNENRFVEAIVENIKSNKMAVEKLESEIKAMTTGRINRTIKQPFELLETRNAKRYVWRSAEDKSKAIDDAKTQLAMLGQRDKLIPQINIGPQMKVGTIGKLPQSQSEKATVIRNDTAFQGERTTFYRYTAFQVIDEANVLVKIAKTTVFFAEAAPPESSYIFWMKGPTSGMADGSPIDLADVYKVTGTKQYSTPTGASMTAFVLERFDADDLLKRAFGD